MFRKSILAIAAVCALGTAALIPTAADAHWSGHYGWYGKSYAPYPMFYGYRYFHGPRYAYWSTAPGGPIGTGTDAVSGQRRRPLPASPRPFRT